MIDLILLFLGLSFGAVFLIVLLIGDWKEARCAKQAKTLQEQLTAARLPQEGVWPPPPTVSALPHPSSPAAPARKSVGSRKSTILVYAFFRFRSYALGTVLVAYIIYSSYPKFGFGWALLVTSLACITLVIIISKLRSKSGRF